MFKVNLNTGEGYEVTSFPDNQPHIKLKGWKQEDMAAKVVCSLTSSRNLLVLCEVANALDGIHLHKAHLHIPYLMGARSDRHMEVGDSFDLKVIANIINSLGFAHVYLYDPHSNAAPLLINNSIVITNEILVKAYNKPDSVLIIPDAGAEKKSHDYTMWNHNLTSIIQCLKTRDLKTGEVTGIEVFNPERAMGKDCVIIDDICDGGRTFIEIAKVLEEHPLVMSAISSLTLVVTHGIFSKGFEPFYDVFDQIITSNTFNHAYSWSKVKCINYEY